MFICVTWKTGDTRLLYRIYMNRLSGRWKLFKIRHVAHLITMHYTLNFQNSSQSLCPPPPMVTVISLPVTWGNHPNEQVSCKLSNRNYIPCNKASRCCCCSSFNGPQKLVCMTCNSSLCTSEATLSSSEQAAAIAQQTHTRQFIGTVHRHNGSCIKISLNWSLCIGLHWAWLYITLVLRHL